MESNPDIKPSLPEDGIAPALVIEASRIPNAVLQRLIAEVKSDASGNPSSYNRSHNRHNRSR